jgi:hypothetical protein
VEWSHIHFLCLGFQQGVCMLVWPRWFWYVMQGWWAYENPEQVRLTDAYRVGNAIQAVSVILLRVFGLYFSSNPGRSSSVTVCRSLWCCGRQHCRVEKR